MIGTARGDIPYEEQADRRACGAASLCMVYRSFGLACSQPEVWARVARPGPREIPRSNTHQLCADALGLGLAALTLRARDPWRVLELCVRNSVRAILNYRPTPTGA